jgi:hypothetical protein
MAFGFQARNVLLLWIKIEMEQDLGRLRRSCGQRPRSLIFATLGTSNNLGILLLAQEVVAIRRRLVPFRHSKSERFSEPRWPRRRAPGSFCRWRKWEVKFPGKCEVLQVL